MSTWNFAFDGYCKNLHLPQYMTRDHITGSLIGWAPISNTVVDHIIGYVPESTDIDGDENDNIDDDVNIINLVGSDHVVNSTLDNFPAQ